MSVPGRNFWIKSTALILTAGLISACDDGISLKPIGDRLDPIPGNSQAAPRPKPDSRGVITYPNYQVIIAKSGDSLDAVAARVGMTGADLGRYNGLPDGYRPRAGEVLALPKGVGGQTSGDIATTALDDGSANGRSPGQEPIRHRVEQGETAYSIARLYGVSVTALASWNGLDRDLSVRTGQQLLIPVAGGTAPRSSASTAPGAGSNTPNPPSSTKPLPPTTETAAIPASPNLANDRTPTGSSGKMLKPVNGKTIKGYSKGGNEGINIAASAGTTVKAAAGGEVALVSKSVGQSTIVLIRHPDNLYTVYSNVTDVSLSKGQSVKRGQSVGKVSGGSPSYLHFEIRRGTESVDPAPYL